MISGHQRVIIHANINELEQAAQAAATALWRWQAEKTGGSVLIVSHEAGAEYQVSRNKTGVLVWSYGLARSEGRI